MKKFATDTFFPIFHPICLLNIVLMAAYVYLTKRREYKCDSANGGMPDVEIWKGENGEGNVGRAYLFQGFRYTGNIISGSTY